MADLHVVYTETGDDYGWTIESPQIPELIGRDMAAAGRGELDRGTQRIVGAG